MEVSMTKEIVNISNEIINGSISLIDGCRQLVSLKLEEDIRDDEDFLIIRGFESQTDEYPTGTERQCYSKDYLKKIDQEERVYLEQAKPLVIKACENLIAKYD